MAAGFLLLDFIDFSYLRVYWLLVMAHPDNSAIHRNWAFFVTYSLLISFWKFRQPKVGAKETFMRNVFIRHTVSVAATIVKPSELNDSLN